MNYYPFHSTAHLATMAAYLKSTNQTLLGQLNELYKQYGYHYTNNSYFICHEPDTIIKIFERIRNFQNAQNTVRICFTIQIKLWNIL